MESTLHSCRDKITVKSRRERGGGGRGGLSARERLRNPWNPPLATPLFLWPEDDIIAPKSLSLMGFCILLAISRHWVESSWRSFLTIPNSKKCILVLSTEFCLPEERRDTRHHICFGCWDKKKPFHYLLEYTKDQNTIGTKISQMSLTSCAGNPGWSGTRPKLFCCEAWWLHSNKRYTIKYCSVHSP